LNLKSGNWKGEKAPESLVPAGVTYLPLPTFRYLPSVTYLPQFQASAAG